MREAQVWECFDLAGLKSHKRQIIQKVWANPSLFILYIIFIKLLLFTKSKL